MLDVDRPRPPATRPARPRRRAGQLLAVAALIVAVLAGGALAVRFVSSAPDATGRAATGARVRARPGDGTMTAILTVDRLRVEVLVLPARVGANQVHVTVYAAEGTARVDDFQVGFDPPPGTGPAGGLVPDRVAANHFLVPAATLPAPGDWLLRLTMRVTQTGEDGATLVPARAVEADVELPVS